MKRSSVPPGCLVTYSGRLLNFENPRPEMIDILDIAVGLSREFRFGNQTQAAYSVAQHSLLVCTLSGPFDLEGLLHDASEAYMKDIPAPLKVSMSEYKVIEARLMDVIAQRFGFRSGWRTPVKHADITALDFEWEQLIVERNESFCYSMQESRLRFLERYNRIIS
jgi:5'-deoxynucleotidase YfbR-like HD superfamily hydrolase